MAAFAYTSGLEYLAPGWAYLSVLDPGARFRWFRGGPVFEVLGGMWYRSAGDEIGGPWHCDNPAAVVFVGDEPDPAAPEGWAHV